MKEVVWKGSILYDSNHMTFWKRQNWRQQKGLTFALGHRGWVAGQGGGDKRKNSEDFECGRTVLYETKKTDTCHNTTSKCIKSTVIRRNPNVNYRLWIMICQCRFISFNNCTTVMQDIDSGESLGRQTRGYMESFFSFHSVLWWIKLL